MTIGRTPGRLRYQPALDGLRGVALLGVIAYHAGIQQLRGGFLGVSAFFTLSGFLITSLLLAEKLDTGRVDLASFWARRVRRLLPAALVAIVATLALAVVMGDDSQLSRLRLDSMASLFHFSNWRFIIGGDSYGAQFDSPSFFRHFWSLAVEEQFYLVFPLVVAGALRWWRASGRALSTALGGVAIAAVAWPAVMLAGGASTDRLYFGTDSRLGELVIGAVLARWWVSRGREVPDRPVAFNAAAAVAVGMLAWMWSNAHPDDRYLYRGGLALHAVLTLVVIVAVIAPRGPLRAIFSLAPLRRLGVISYGAYLLHWPVLLWLQQETSMGPLSRFVVGVVIATGLAELSYRFVELPIKRGSGGVVRRQTWLVVPASLAVAAVAVAVTVWRAPTGEPIDFAAVEDELKELTTEAPSPPISASTTVLVAPTDSEVLESGGNVSPLRIAAFGDSTALMTSFGVGKWAVDNPDRLLMVPGVAKLGCGLVGGGRFRLEGRENPVPGDCDEWLSQWVEAIRGSDVDLSLIQLGAWEIVDHQLEPGEPFVAIGGDPEFDDLLRANLDMAIAALLEDSDLVVLLAQPDIGRSRLDAVPAGTSYPEHDPARTVRWREIEEDAAATNPAVIVVDLASWVAAHPDDPRLRPDGLHFTDESSNEVADWLVPELLVRYDEWLEQVTQAPEGGGD